MERVCNFWTIFEATFDRCWTDDEPSKLWLELSLVFFVRIVTLTGLAKQIYIGPSQLISDHHTDICYHWKDFWINENILVTLDVVDFTGHVPSLARGIPSPTLHSLVLLVWGQNPESVTKIVKSWTLTPPLVTLLLLNQTFVQIPHWIDT